MAFDQTRRRKTYELTMRPYPGLTVWCRKPGFTALEELSGALLALGDDFDGPRLVSSDRVRWWGVLFRAFARSLLAWNLVDDGRPVPATEAGVLAQDPEFLLALARTWYWTVVMHTEQPEPPAESTREDDTDDRTDETDEAAELEAHLADIPITINDTPEPEREPAGEPDLVPA